MTLIKPVVEGNLLGYFMYYCQPLQDCHIFCKFAAEKTFTA